MTVIKDNFVQENEDHYKCRWSTGVHDHLTVGQGELDEYGFWERPCSICARKHEAEHPGSMVWPHSKKYFENNKPLNNS